MRVFSFSAVDRWIFFFLQLSRFSLSCHTQSLSLSLNPLSHLAHRREHNHGQVLRERADDVRDLAHPRGVGDGRASKLVDDGRRGFAEPRRGQADVERVGSRRGGGATSRSARGRGGGRARGRASGARRQQKRSCRRWPCRRARRGWSKKSRSWRRGRRAAGSSHCPHVALGWEALAVVLGLRLASGKRSGGQRARMEENWLSIARVE